MPCCFVPGCNVGSGKHSKGTLFQVPSDKDQLEKWRHCIPRADRILGETDRVCERHFSEEFIERKFLMSGPDGKKIEIERERPRLKMEAIPHLFPNLPHYLSRNISSRRVNKLQRIKDSIRGVDAVSLHSSELLHSSEPLHSTEPVLEFVHDNNDEMDFNGFCEASSDICPRSWVAHYNSEILCFGKLDICNKQMEISTSVSIDRELKLSIFSYGNITNIQECSYVCSKLYMTNLLQRLDNALTCSGVSTLHVDSFKSKLGLIDKAGVFRSKCCSMLIYKKGSCKYCNKLRKLLLNNKRRRTVNCELKSRKERVMKSLKKSNRYHRNKLMKSRINTNILDSRIISSLPENQLLAIQQCIGQSKCKTTKGMRYNKKWILNCLLLRIKSPKAYLHLTKNKILALPSRSTLQRYIDSVKTDIGINEQALAVLSQRMSTSADRHGILIFDEVKLREGVQFSLKKCQYQGVVDLGEFSEPSHACADTGLVFMYRPVMGNWFQSVAVYLNKGPTKSCILSKMLLHVILALESHGLWVSGVVCDGSTLNRGLWKEFGIAGSREQICNSTINPALSISSSEQAGRRLFFFSDYVHLFKCMRNNLLNKGFFDLPDGVVKLSYFQQLLKLDNQHGGLRAVPKLTYNHVEPNNLQRMNVRLAVQLFSNSVADGLEFYKQKRCPEMQDVDATVAFVRRVNRLFDILNAKLPRLGLRLASENMMFLRDCADWLDDWEAHVKKCGSVGFLSASTSAGLRVTLKSTIELSEQLLNSGFSYILTSRFSQDPLELLFGQIRNAAGCEDHPTGSMFMQLFKLLSLYSLAKPAGKSSGNNLSLSASSGPSKRKETVLQVTETLSSLSVFVDDCDSSDESFNQEASVVEPECSDIKNSIIYYVTGFVLRHCRNVCNCHFCFSFLSSPTENHECGDLTNVKLRGRLLFPSWVLFEALKKIEVSIVGHLSESIFGMFEDIIRDTVQYLIPVRAGLCVEHQWLAGEILVYYITTRLHWQCKQVSRSAVSARITKQNRKKAKLC